MWAVNGEDETAGVIAGDVDIGSLLGAWKVCRVRRLTSAQ
jgi:hypothetical protein